MQTLPDTYVNEKGDNFTDPVFLLTADGYYGDTSWLEGDRIVWLETPNHSMQPLNRAAADAIQRWQDSLPLNGESVTQDMLDEARRFMPPEAAEKMDLESYQKALFKTAVAIKHKREQKPGLVLPHMQPRSAGPGTAPVMPNAAIASMRDGPAGFGEVRGKPQQASQQRAARSTRAMGNTDAPAPG